MVVKAKIFLLAAVITVHLAVPCNAQTTAVDSLNTLIKKLPEDTARVNRMITLCSQYNRIGLYDSSFSVATRAVRLAERIHYSKGIAAASVQQGWGYYTKSEYDKVIDLAGTALAIYRSANSSKDEALVLLLMAHTYMVQGDYDTTSHFIQKAIEIFDGIRYKPGQASALAALGNLYDMQSNLEGALKVYLEAMKIYDELADEYGAGNIYQSLAEAYRRLKIFDKAKAFLFKQLQYHRKINHAPFMASAYIGLGNIHQDEKNYDSALFYFQQARMIYEKSMDNYSLAIALNNIGDVYRLIGSYAKATDYYERSLSLCYRIRDHEGTIYPLDGMALIYTQTGNFSKASEYLEKARKEAMALGLPHLLSDNYLHSAQLDSARQHFSLAYGWHKKYAHVKDSLQRSQNTRLIVEMQTRFESEKKDQQISFLNEERKLKAAQSRKERNFYLVLLVISTSLTAALLYIVFQKIRTGKILRQQRNEILEKNEELHCAHKEIKKVLETIEMQKHRSREE